MQWVAWIAQALHGLPHGKGRCARCIRQFAGKHLGHEWVVLWRAAANTMHFREEACVSLPGSFDLCFGAVRGDRNAVEAKMS